MKQSIYVISALFFFAFFTSCEKFELEDHCPEDQQGETIENPQDLRVNDDSDSEESGSTQVSRDFSDNIAPEGNNDKYGIDDPTGDNDDEDEELINDDSDDEDEGGDQNRRPGGNNGSTTGGNPLK